MGTRIKIKYNFYNNSSERIIDPDTYGYLDVVYDVYSTVWKHIPDGRTCTFSVNCILNRGGEEMEINSDATVSMFDKHINAHEIKLYVYNIQIAYRHTITQFEDPSTPRQAHSFMGSKEVMFTSDAITSTREKDIKPKGKEEDTDGIDERITGGSTHLSDNELVGYVDSSNDVDWDGDDGDEVDKSDGSDQNEEDVEGYVDINAFRAALQNYLIEEGVDVIRLKNEKAKVTAICVASGCP
ncbi:hypothetical protein NE237_002247 [Protea cynaroides]|uniref:Transposase MuDR plant domain-containing protein n=1 Tax=Protea cynaroides TaxID=273540 RepID=A0A9Q0KUW8_9MAGN|nr:hypothetical protein NE237_002247 [Protea cynaroides]